MKPTPTIYNMQWEKKFDQLVAFRKAYGHCNVPGGYKDNPTLGQWVITQRYNRKKGNLNRSRIQRLAGIGFAWRLKDQSSWDKMFYELLEFKNRYGHCDVPTNWAENRNLAYWVVNQRRRRYENDPIGKERIRRLEEIGFKWRVFPDWEENFSKLVKFKQAHGHCDVAPGNCAESKKLNAWVKSQRNNRKQGRLGKDRIKRLNELGFIWDKSGPTWKEMFSLLLQYKKEHGNCDVPRVWAKNPQLGRWVINQRYFRKKNKLSEDRVKRLDEIGFQWQIRKRAAKGG